MSKAVTFLTLAVAGWVGLRAVAFGIAPGAMAQAPLAEDLAPAPLAAMAPPGVSTPAMAPQPQWPVYLPYPIEQAGAQQLPPQIIYRTIPAQGGQAPVIIYAAPPQYPVQYAGYAGAPSFWPGMAAAPFPTGGPIPQQSAAIPTSTPPLESGKPLFKLPSKLSLSSWGFFRREDGFSSSSLAPGGTLGASQAGARMLYQFDDRFAASARLTSGAGNVAGAEAAIGLRVTPFKGLPLHINAERRQNVGTGPAGRSAFALYAEGGMYDRPVGAGFNADAYAQGGVVGLNSRDLFIDGGLTLTRDMPLGLEAGVGVWGAAQPGVHRLDVGPRVSVPLHRTITAHIDWRQQVAGNAEPGSGPALTIASDF
ncbi:hypothetical protein [Sphingomicrobium flavum]|uniref:hypothetical protein n=1 Tax=Sphingomicrobium flavum TaxID=1229164 RepID=UPI0021AE2E8B|nr:hypothetical protein [Sphingomicrobium flavum]